MSMRFGELVVSLTWLCGACISLQDPQPLLDACINKYVLFPTECLALVSLAIGLGVPSDPRSAEMAELRAGGWLNMEKDYCSWKGIRCSKANKQNIVTSVELELKKRPSKLGILSDAIGDLKGLVTLHLDYHEGNNIGGTIPRALGNCIHLEELILNGHEKITGIIPSTFRKLKKLRVLHLDHNALRGTIPSFLTSMRRLEELYLEHNMFHGPVPDELDAGPSLYALDLSENPSLSGYVPHMGPGHRDETKRLLQEEDENAEGILDFIDEMGAFASHGNMGEL